MLLHDSPHVFLRSLTHQVVQFFAGTSQLPAIQAFFAIGSTESEFREMTTMFISSLFVEKAAQWTGKDALPWLNVVGVITGRIAVAELIIALWL